MGVANVFLPAHDTSFLSAAGAVDSQSSQEHAEQQLAMFPPKLWGLHTLVMPRLDSCHLVKAARCKGPGLDLFVTGHGVIAQGKMRMVGANTVQGQDESEVLRLAAAVEGSTRHPLADAVLLAANNKRLQVRRCCCYAAT